MQVVSKENPNTSVEIQLKIQRTPMKIKSRWKLNENYAIRRTSNLNWKVNENQKSKETHYIEGDTDEIVAGIIKVLKDDIKAI